MKLLDSFLRKTLTACACYYLAVFCLVGAVRMSFPGALAWLESNSYYQVVRVLAGQALYIEPCLEYVPFPYPPLYFCVSALLACITGPGFLPLRLVSYLATLGSMALIGYIVYREGRSRTAGLWAAGLFAATYCLSATYFDMGRVDSLFLFMFLGALCAVRFAQGIQGCILAGALLAAAALTKQTGFLLSLPLMLYVFLYRTRPQAFWFAGAFLVPAGLASLWLDASSEGWYFFYTFTIPSQHEILWPRMGSFWLQQILAPLGIAACMAVSAFFLSSFKKHRDRVLLYAPTLATMLAVACMHWIKIAAYKNVLMPAHAALAVGFGLALAASPKNRVKRLLLLAACIQFALLYYNPGPLLPAAENAETVRRAVAVIKNIEGEVFAPANGYLAVMAGKKHSAHISCINDIIFSDSGAVRDKLINEITGAVREKRFEVLLLDRKFQFFQDEIEAHYIPSPHYAREPAFRPLIKYWCIARP